MVWYKKTTWSVISIEKEKKTAPFFFVPRPRGGVVDFLAARRYSKTVHVYAVGTNLATDGRIS